MDYYFVDKNNLRKGPIYENELADYDITPETLVWCEGMNNWTAAKDVEGLSFLFKTKNVADIFEEPREENTIVAASSDSGVNVIPKVEEATVITPQFGNSSRQDYPSQAPYSYPPYQQAPKRGVNKTVIGLLSGLIVLLLGFLVFLFINNSEKEKQLEQEKAVAIQQKNEAERKKAEAEKQRLEEEKRLAEAQRQAEIEAEAQRQAEIERHKALANSYAASGPYYISGTLNGDDVDFDIYVYDDGSVSGSFTNYSMGTGWDVAGTMKANSFSFYSVNNSVNWRFNASRSSGNSFSGTCSNGKITYSMYLDVERQ